MLLMNSDRKLLEDNMGVSNFRFLGGVIVGDMGDILLLPLKMQTHNRYSTLTLWYLSSASAAIRFVK